MGFFTLLEVASMPILQVLLVGGLGAFLATDYSKLLPEDARRSMNKIVFAVFTPCLMFASLAGTVTLQDIISWWFMPINVGLTFFFGGILGWIAVKLLKPEPYLEGLIIAICSSANLGNLVLIIVPAVCNEDGSPFGNSKACSAIGLSYASFSMALGGFFIWTVSYQMVQSSVTRYRALQAAEQVIKEANEDFNANEKTHLLKGDSQENHSTATPSSKSSEIDTESQLVSASPPEKEHKSWSSKLLEVLIQIGKELLAPPTLGAILGLVVGVISWLKNLIIGEGAPLHVIQDSIKLLGEGTIPCITLILGGSLARGVGTAKLKLRMVIGVLVVKYLLLPLIGVGVVKLAGYLGFLPSDPLYHFVLMLQFALPPAMNISTMTQFFDVGQDESSVLFLWTYLVAAFALTIWATVFMWILS
ncbi:Protein PIN-LIKES 7 [Ancistrocladus abbreviatus]